MPVGNDNWGIAYKVVRRDMTSVFAAPPWRRRYRMGRLHRGYQGTPLFVFRTLEGARLACCCVFRKGTHLLCCVEPDLRRVRIFKVQAFNLRNAPRELAPVLAPWTWAQFWENPNIGSCPPPEDTLICDALRLEREERCDVRLT